MVIIIKIRKQLPWNSSPASVIIGWFSWNCRPVAIKSVENWCILDGWIVTMLVGTTVIAAEWGRSTDCDDPCGIVTTVGWPDATGWWLFGAGRRSEPTLWTRTCRRTTAPDCCWWWCGCCCCCCCFLVRDVTGEGDIIVGCGWRSWRVPRLVCAIDSRRLAAEYREVVGGRLLVLAAFWRWSWSFAARTGVAVTTTGVEIIDTTGCCQRVDGRLVTVADAGTHKLASIVAPNSVPGRSTGPICSDDWTTLLASIDSILMADEMAFVATASSAQMLTGNWILRPEQSLYMPVGRFNRDDIYKQIN